MPFNFLTREILQPPKRIITLFFNFPESISDIIKTILKKRKRKQMHGPRWQVEMLDGAFLEQAANLQGEILKYNNTRFPY